MSVETEMLRTGEVLIRLNGALNRRSVPKIRKHVLRIGRNRTIRSVVVDFAAVTEMDTAGLAMLIELLQVLTRRDGRLKLSGLSEGVQRVIHLARLEQVFEIQADSSVTSVQ